VTKPMPFQHRERIKRFDPASDRHFGKELAQSPNPIIRSFTTN
jgi:hypothetical protein